MSEREIDPSDPRDLPDRTCFWCDAPLTDQNAKRGTCDLCEDVNICDCGATTTGKWAGVHHPNCPAVAEHARGFAAGIEEAAQLIEHPLTLLSNEAKRAFAKAIRALLPPVPERKPLKLEISREWCERAAMLEGDHEVGAGTSMLSPVDETKKWQEIAGQGVQIEHKLRVEIEQLRAQLSAMREALEPFGWKPKDTRTS